MRNKTGYLGLIICGWLIGCASIRSAREAQDTMKIPAGERTVTAAEVGLTKDSILTLPRALEIALHYHPSVVQARQNLIVVEKQFREAIAGYLPEVDASATYRKATNNTDAGSETNKTDHAYSISASLSQLIYDFGKTPASIRQFYENKLASEATLLSTENSLIYKVKQAYYDLIKQEALVKVSEEMVNQFQIHLNNVRSLVEVGRRIKYDITKAEVDLSNAQINLINARTGLNTARAVLNNTLGLAEDPGYRIEPPSTDEFGDIDLAELIRMGREKQPELVAQRARQRAAAAAVDQAIADLFPSLSLGGSYSWSGRNFPLVWNWSLSALLGWNIFSGFQKINAIDKAVANLRISRAETASLEQRICLDLTRAYGELVSARQRLNLTNLTVKRAEENLHLVNECYKIGRASSLEVTDALVSLSQARVDQIQAQFDYQTALALIKKTIGER